MAKKVLGILGSPRKNGNVSALMKKVLSAAEASGSEVKQIHLYDLNIQFCMGCMACREKGHCVINDDLNGLAREIISSDVVVLAAPTYWANVPAAVKNMFDRMAGYVMKCHRGKPPRPLCSKSQEYILITACTTGYPFNVVFGQSTGALRAMNEFFKTSGMNKKGTITLSNTWAADKIPVKTLEKAEKLGNAI